MFGCGGGGGGGDNTNTPVSTPSTTVTVRGKVDDGTPNSPIANAQCQVADVHGSMVGSATTDTNGLFQVGIPPGTDTFIGCNPQALPNLGLQALLEVNLRLATIDHLSNGYDVL
jgi:hypothetical protein